MTRAFAPGRVNLIGEHTDYNAGLALPFAIERGVTVTTQRLDGGRFEVEALDLGERDRFDPGELRRGPRALDRGEPPTGGWRALVRGIAAELRTAGIAVPPARIAIAGDLPRGAGLSSSAALEAALALALADLAGGPEPNRVELAKLCSRVEHEWAGARTGLLDQLAVLLGAKGRALRIDFRTLAVEPVPLELGDWTLATLDSGAARSHAESGYNERREECDRAAAKLGLESLRDATLGEADSLGGPLGRRVRHVVGENARVEEAAGALGRGDLERLGALLDASHASLRDDFEVSTSEVEAAVEAMRRAGAAGARVVGGGFGGSVLGLFPPAAGPPEGAIVVRPGPAARLLGRV